ncbi:neurofilament heavy polypeptide isoform X1 [Exaiptasia diaphana]|uniref:Uncharacterized protein n=1 Tax=Exaiptasia diaphana TaxID=2652724 RepID=A0A913X1B6_EXADI|nr:neurofilament heavy polypeptide isoform X1 [Exaiptasia diaphana]
MQTDENQAALGLTTASQSSSEEDLTNNNYEIAAQLPKEEKVPAWEDEVRVEKVRLPPIFKAAAERPRNRTVDESNEILRGQKSTQFEPKPKVNVQISEPEIRIKSPQKLRHDESRRSHSPPKKALLSSEEVPHKRATTYTKVKKYSDAALKGSSELQQVERKEEKTEKPKKKRKSRSRSPIKSVIQASKTHEKNTSLNDENTQISKHKEEIIQVTFQTNQMTVRDIESQPKIIGASQKQPDSLVDDIRDMTKMPNNPVGLCLKEGDFVAIKVPSKLYIKGQPCLGKVTTMEDNLGLLTVHYYTGSYEGYWRPMMSRTSPYLRKVPHQSILCKFKLSTEGRMSPITRAKVRKVVDGEEQK